MRLFGFQCSGLVALWLTYSPAVAHEDLHRQIAALSKEISSHPNKAELFLRRADLYRRHEEWTAAADDYQIASEKGGNQLEILLGMAQLSLDKGSPNQTLALTGKLLDQNPAIKSGTAHLLRARALAKLDRPDDAVAAYDTAIANLATPQPDHHLERFRLAIASADSTDERKRALDALDLAARQMDEHVSLHSIALREERKLGYYDSALTRIEKMIAKHGQVIPWLIAKAEILESAKQRSQAKEAWQKASEALSSIPSRRRNTKVAQLWRQSIQAGLRTPIEGQ